METTTTLPEITDIKKYPSNINYDEITKISQISQNDMTPGKYYVLSKLGEARLFALCLNTEYTVPGYTIPGYTMPGYTVPEHYTYENGKITIIPENSIPAKIVDDTIIDNKKTVSILVIDNNKMFVREIPNDYDIYNYLDSNTGGRRRRTKHAAKRRRNTRRRNRRN